MRSRSEWTLLGDRLADLAPAKFDEILAALRETLAAHEILRRAVNADLSSPSKV